MYKLPFLENGVKLPRFTIDERHIKHLNLKPGVSDYDFLRALTLEGFNKLKLKKGSLEYAEYVARIKKELDIFRELGFCAYLLVTWDIMNFCHENGIATGYGRGSACGSEVLTLIGVTKVDAIKNGLFFERFLSKFRAKFKEIDGEKYYQGDLLLDIDLDIEFRERERVVEYVESRYPGQVCKLLTTSTFTTKILVKDVCKIYLDFNEDEAKHISDMIPKNAGFVSSLENSRKESKDFDAFCNEHPDFYDICCSLSDLHNNFGCHPSAVIISSQPLAEFMPLQLSESGEAITGFAMTDVSNMAPKVDLLGLRCATLLSQCCAKLGIKTTDIDIHHPSIYDGLQNLEWPKGLFQIEADTNFNVTRKVKPRNLMHLAAVLSLARPGSIQFVGTYEKYVATGDAQSVHPLFDDILKESAGIPIYQESLMKCANRIGFSLDESETLRRIVGKKKREEMPEWKAKVEAKIKENNLDPRAGEILWKVMEDSASYSFNLSHAVAYASMCAATCYLKFNHPQIFYETLLNLAKDEPDSLDEIKIISGEMRQKGIALLPPDITKSAKDFAIEGDAVRFGLSNIRGISDTTMSKLVSFKRDFPDKFALFSGAKEAGLTIGVLQSLIMSGCVNIDKTPRTKLAVESAMFNELTQRERDNIIPLFAAEYNYDLIELLKGIQSKVDEKGKPYIKPSRMETYRRDIKSIWAQYQANAKHEELAAYLFERFLLGFSYSNSLFNLYARKVEGLTPIADVLTQPKGTSVSFVAFVDDFKKATGRESKKEYVRFELSEESGSIKAMISGSDKINKCVQFNGELPEIGQIVIIHGKTGDGIVFVDSLVTQRTAIRLKKSGEVEAAT